MAKIHMSPLPKRRRISTGKPTTKPWGTTLSPTRKAHVSAVNVTRRIGQRTRLSDGRGRATALPKNTRFIEQHHDFDPHEDTYYDDDDVQESDHDDGEDSQDDNEDSLFHWEEESTLFSDLLEETPGDADPKARHLEALVEKLQPSFTQCGRELKKEIAETLVPTVNRVKALYHVLDTKVDMAYGRGILTFNDACKEMEALAIDEKDEVRAAWLAAQISIEDAFVQLKEAYARRERLWTDFDKALDEIVEPTLESLKAVPAQVERTIAKLEKEARKLDKDDPGMAGANEKLKGLLSKMS